MVQKIHQHQHFLKIVVVYILQFVEQSFQERVKSLHKQIPRSKYLVKVETE